VFGVNRGSNVGGALCHDGDTGAAGAGDAITKARHFGHLTALSLHAVPQLPQDFTVRVSVLPSCL